VAVIASPTTSDLEAELTMLETEAGQLEAELVAKSGGQPVSTAPNTSCGVTFCRDLTLGDTGPDVMALQQFLNQNGYPVALSGPGSSGNETQYFGMMTQAALAGWQSATGISPASGYFGPTTRADVEAEMSNNASSSVSAAAPMIPAAPITPAPSY
jgi:peptidoglycan hydrolase-like protein with peptidoglycan-binding domain